MSQSTEQEFGKLRSMLWPIHGHELKKLLPMFLMFFCISFNYTILRDTKDTLVVTASGSGAEAIPFLKVWCVVPSAIIFMLIYSKLSNILSKERLFYAAITPFLIFFALFPTVLYPNREILHPVASADYLATILPAGLKGLIAIYRNWTYSIFYILAELWGSVALSLLFWGFANEITRVKEAKRFYHLFAIGANLALLISGPAIVKVSDIQSKLPAGVDAWQISLNYLMTMVIVAGIVIIATYRWMNTNVLTDPRFFDPKDVKKKKSKPKMSIGESLRYLASSKYMLCLAALTICYGASINLVEVVWKAKLKTYCSTPNEYSTFMGKFSTVVGAATIFMVLFVSRIFMKRGWGIAAMVTPVVLAITGLSFFAVVLFEDATMGIMAALGTTPLVFAVMAGAAQNVLSKSTKYSLFDPTKEMAYIPLDQEQKVKGKAAIDVVAARFGKSGGSLIQQGLLIALGSISLITPYIAVIILGIIGAWLFSVRSLNKQFVALTNEKAQEEESSQQAPETAAQPAS